MHNQFSAKMSLTSIECNYTDQNKSVSSKSNIFNKEIPYSILRIDLQRRIYQLTIRCCCASLSNHAAQISSASARRHSTTMLYNDVSKPIKPGEAHSDIIMFSKYRGSPLQSKSRRSMVRSSARWLADGNDRSSRNGDIKLGDNGCCQISVVEVSSPLLALSIVVIQAKC